MVVQNFELYGGGGGGGAISSCKSRLLSSFSLCHLSTDSDPAIFSVRFYDKSIFFFRLNVFSVRALDLYINDYSYIMN